MERTDPDRPLATQILTTEAYILQSARSAVLADIQSRTSMFLTTVSSTLVALAFIGQVTRVAGPFVVLTDVLLPTLYAMGVITFFRLTQSNIEDGVHAAGLGRVRRYYVDVAPQVRPYLIHQPHDDLPSMIADMGLRPSPWQLVMTTQTMVALVASVILGTFGGFVAVTSFGVDLRAAVVLGAGLGIADVVALTALSGAIWSAAQRRQTVRFPSNGRPEGREPAPYHNG